MKKATLGAGCFWCTEAVYQKMEGVESVASGYTGGHIENPTYKQICTGNSGHAEVVQIDYDENKVSFEEILDVFWRTHDPTTLNRQGNDVGTQYRSAIFYHDEQQRKTAEKSKKEADERGYWPSPIVTEISPIGTFYKAENVHQNFYINNPRQPYCMFVVQPKIDKFEQLFPEKVKGSPRGNY